MIETISAFARGIIYLWVCFEALLGMYVYLIGYKNRKTKQRSWESPIIVALMFLLGSIAFFSLYLCIVTMVRFFKPESYLDVTFWVPFVFIPVGLSLDRFRKESLDDGTAKKINEKIKSSLL